MRRASRLFFVALVIALAPWTSHPRAQVTSTVITGTGGTTFYGIGDLPTGGVNSIVQEATQIGGTVYAVGASTKTATNTPIPTLDTAVVWDSATNALSVIPDLVTFALAPNNAASSAYAITPSAQFIASRARSNAGNANLSLGIKVVRNSLNVPRTIEAFSALDISDDGNVLFGQQFVDNEPPNMSVNNTRAVRVDVSGPLNTRVQVPRLTTNLLGGCVIAGTNPVPPPPQTCSDSIPAYRGMSADGSVLVGTAFSSTFIGTPAAALNQYVTTNGLAFRWNFNEPTVKEIPRPTGGTWSSAIAVSPDGNLTLAGGNSADYPLGEVWIHHENDDTIEELGSPNTALFPKLYGGMTADGTVVGVTFGGGSPLQNPGFNNNPIQYAYLHNSYGWFHLANVLADQGVDLWANGWDPSNMILTGIRTVDTDGDAMTPDVDLVFGQGRRRNADGSAGATEGFVVSFQEGVLASYQLPEAAPVENTALVGAWALGADPNNPPSVIVFTADGIYYSITPRGAAGYANADAKFERGAYTLTAFNALTLTTTEDRDGAGPSATPAPPFVYNGLVSKLNGRQSLSAQFTSIDTFEIQDASCSPVCSIVQATRIAGGAGSIVGGWIAHDVPFLNGGTQVVVLLNSSSGFKLFAAADGDGESNNGSQAGTYTWDPTTHVLEVTDEEGPDNDTTTATLTRDELALHVIVTEQGGDVFPLDFTRIVNPTTVVPSITNTTLEASGDEDSAFSYTVTGLNALTFEATGLPTGLTIDPNTGVVSGTPAVNGTFNVTITVTNTFGDTDTATLVLTFAAPPARIYGIGDLPGAGTGSAVRDATRVNGIIYAVGSSTVNHAVSPFPNLDTPVIWSSQVPPSSGLQALPHSPLPGDPDFISTQTDALTAYAITPDAAYIASQAKRINAPGAPWVRVTRSLLPSTTANFDINVAVGPSTSFAALSISDAGNILYGQEVQADSTRLATRYEFGVGLSRLPLLPGKTWSLPIPRGTSSNGLVMVGVASNGAFTQSPFPPIGLGTNTLAFRYEHTIGTTTAIDLLPAGHWNFPIALSSDGSVTVVAGDSEDFPSGEIYLTDANNDVIEQLGSPNAVLMPRLLGGRTDDGVVAVTFSNSATAGLGQIGGLGLSTGNRYAYIRNSHGWYHFSSVLAGQGVDLVADGWDPTNIAITGVRTVEGVDLVFGQGRRRNPATTVLGALEGFVAELPAGVLANFNPTPTPPSDQSIVGTWLAGDPANPSVVFSYLADGTYVRISIPAAPALPGFERGLYTWAGNAAGGAFVITTLYDTDGTAGGSFRNGQLGLTQIIDGNTITLNDTRCTACGAALGTRLTWDAGSIVGGWIAGNAALPNDWQHAVLLGSASGFKYFFADDSDGAFDGGVDLGTYTWDPITHVFVTNPPDNGTTTATLTRDELGVAVVETEQDGGVSTTTLWRIVAPSTVVPSFGTPLTANGTVAVPFSYTIPATHALTFESSELPAGLSLDSATGAITGTPTTTGDFTIDVTITNTFGASPHAELELTIRRQQADLQIGAPLSEFYGSSFAVTLGGGSGTGAFTLESSNGCTAVGSTVTMTSGTADCTVTAHRAGDNEYWEKTATHVVDATPKPASVTPSSATKVYGASDPAFSGSLSGFLAADGVTAIYARDAGENVVGSPYLITATLSPAGVLSNYNITYNTAPFTITTATTSTTLTSSPNPSSPGQVVNFVATVIGQHNGAVTGIVTFRRGQNTVLGTAAVQANGTATLPLSTLGNGSHVITAHYEGDSNSTGSTSPSVTQNVVAPAAATTTTLTSSLNPSIVGQAVTLTAAVTSGTPGTITGTVTFRRGQIVLSTQALSGGQATYTTTTLPQGSLSLTAVYNGDAKYITSTSPVLSQVVTMAATTTSLSSSPNPSNGNQLVTLTATISSGTPGAITGTVIFKGGQTVLGTGSVSGNQASMTTTALPAGSSNLTAVYVGNATYTGSTSPAITHVVNTATSTTTLSGTPNPSSNQQTVVFTAVVVTSTGAIATGQVSIKEGSATLVTVPLNASGVAVVGLSVPRGQHNLKAVYEGDAYTSKSTSNTYTQTVQ
jgi:hypothetical protein